MAFATLHGLKQGGVLSWLTFFPSLVFGYCRERYGTLVPCIVLHATYNAGIWL
jgi:membrane protease YdiL (CAAX protease family)